MKLHYPVKPFITTQAWGRLNPVYSDHFNDPTFKRHNGTDFVTGQPNEYSLSEFPLYCPVEGFKVFRAQFSETGGGNEVWLVSKEKLTVGGESCYIFLAMLHGKKILTEVGKEPKVGELLMIADNTGFSSGAHCHLGMYRSRTNAWVDKIDANDATGSYNPELNFSGQYAIDLATLPTLIDNNFRYYKYKLGL